MTSQISVLTASALLALVPAIADATEPPKEGSYDITICFTRNITRIVFSDSHRAWSYNETGTTVSTPPGGMFDGESVRCVGAASLFAGKRSGLSICEGVAKDGAKRLTRFQYDADGKLAREEITGTGRYEGLATTGTVRETVAARETAPGTTYFCNQLTGTYKVK